MRLGRVAEADENAGESGAPAKPPGTDRPKIPRDLYDEVRRGFQFHDDANTSLDKKAQNLMVATALVAALFASITIGSVASRPDQDPSWLAAAIAFMTGMVATIGMCVWVNFPRSQPVLIVGGNLLRNDKLDDEVYEEVVGGGEEEYYKARIEECAQALTKQERINKKKARGLRVAYVAFAVSIGGVVVGLFFAIAAVVR